MQDLYSEIKTYSKAAVKFVYDHPYQVIAISIGVGMISISIPYILSNASTELDFKEIISREQFSNAMEKTNFNLAIPTDFALANRETQNFISTVIGGRTDWLPNGEFSYEAYYFAHQKLIDSYNFSIFLKDTLAPLVSCIGVVVIASGIGSCLIESE